MVIAMRASVTVSMAELSKGMFKAIDWVTRAWRIGRIWQNVGRTGYK